MDEVWFVFDTGVVWREGVVGANDRHVQVCSDCGAGVSYVFLSHEHERVLVLIEDVDCLDGGAHGSMKMRCALVEVECTFCTVMLLNPSTSTLPPQSRLSMWYPYYIRVQRRFRFIYTSRWCSVKFI